MYPRRAGATGLKAAAPGAACDFTGGSPGPRDACVQKPLCGAGWSRRDALAGDPRIWVTPDALPGPSQNASATCPHCRRDELGPCGGVAPGSATRVYAHDALCRLGANCMNRGVFQQYHFIAERGSQFLHALSALRHRPAQTPNPYSPTPNPPPATSVAPQPSIPPNRTRPVWPG